MTTFTWKWLGRYPRRTVHFQWRWPFVRCHLGICMCEINEILKK